MRRRSQRGARRLTLGILAVLVVPVAAGAQTVVARQVEFDQAVQQAVERNPTIAQAATAVARANALVAQARASILPSVTAGVVNTTLDSARGFDGGVTQPQNQFAFTANATLPLLAASGRAAVDQARDQVDVARLTTADVRQQIAVAAAQAYLTVIASRRQVDVDERAVENAQAHLDYAERRLDAGAGSRLNQLRAAQEAASAESRLETSRLGLRQAQEALGVILVEEGPVDAAAEPVFETPVVTGTEWMSARPDVQRGEAVRRAAERVLRDSWKEWLPTAAASFDPQYITPSGLFQPSRTWRLSVTLSQPVFEGGQRRAARALRAAAADESALALTAVEIQARAEVRLAQESLRVLERAQDAARLAAQHAQEVLEITTTAFEVGATTNIEVIDAQRSVRDAETAAARTEDAVRRAHLDLLVALGRFPR
jgi:outer membrane protein TolC